MSKDWPAQRSGDPQPTNHRLLQQAAYRVTHGTGRSANWCTFATWASLRGVFYKDLFSRNIMCGHDVTKLMEQYRVYPNYEARCVEGIGAELPVIDKIITDNNEVRLSQVSFKGAAPMPMYVYIQSEAMAEFYAGLYNDCWRFSLRQVSLST